MVPPRVVVRSGQSLKRETDSQCSCHCQGGGLEETVHTLHTCTGAHTQQGCHHLSTNFHSQSTSQPLSHLLHTAPGRNRASTHIPIFKFHLYIPSCTGSPLLHVGFSSCGEWWGHSLVVVGGLLIGVACGLNSCGAQA